MDEKFKSLVFVVIILSLCMVGLAMFTSKVNNRCNDIEEQINQPEYIGEYLREGRQFMRDDVGNVTVKSYYYWVKFIEEDYEDSVNGYIKIDGDWVEKEHMFFYANIEDKYTEKRKEIEKLKKGEEE
jgi:hypothetical protein